MTKNYEAMTVGGLITALGAMHPETIIVGLSDSSGSYRGYYKHVAIHPGAGVRAGALKEHLEGKLGTMMTGYKGGDFEFASDRYVFVANYGYTGPFLAGFEGEGVELEPVLVEQGWF